MTMFTSTAHSRHVISALILFAHALTTTNYQMDIRALSVIRAQFGRCKLFLPMVYVDFMGEFLVGSSGEQERVSSEFSRCIYLVTTTYMAGARELAGSRWMKERTWVVTHETIPRIQPCLRTDRNAGKETLVAFPSGRNDLARTSAKRFAPAGPRCFLKISTGLVQNAGTYQVITITTVPGIGSHKSLNVKGSCQRTIVTVDPNSTVPEFSALDCVEPLRREGITTVTVRDTKQSRSSWLKAWPGYLEFPKV